ncbi:MAG TPA: universal stress protein [Solirubrobacterales bacterium]|nr:universal stress protein [Solirubrobacterales bacterium]
MSDKDPNGAPRRLLLGFDGSDGAKDAVELCRALATDDAYVAVVDVLPYPGAPSEAFRLLTTAEFPAPEDYFRPATSRLEGRKVDTLTYVGDSPARVFESLATTENLEMIVIGCPHRGMVGRILAGSVAEALLHGSPVPVATAPHGYASTPHDGLDTIAVAYDGGEESQTALAYAQAIALARGASLDVLTVERPVDPVGGAIALTMSLPENVDQIQRQALHEIDPSIDLRRRRLHGETAAALAEACREGVDLLVVGSRGYGTVERVLLGSTSTGVIRQATCPVVVVPRPAEEDTKPRRTSGVMIADEAEGAGHGAVGAN